MAASIVTLGRSFAFAAGDRGVVTRGPSPSFDIKCMRRIFCWGRAVAAEPSVRNAVIW